MKRYAAALLLIFIISQTITVLGEMPDEEKKATLRDCYIQAFYEAKLWDELPKRACGWVAYRTWELGTERGIDVDAVWLCRDDRFRSHIIPVVMLSNGVFYGYQWDYQPYDYYTMNYFGKQEIFDTWDFDVVSWTGASWPVNISKRDGIHRIYIRGMK